MKALASAILAASFSLAGAMTAHAAAADFAGIYKGIVPTGVADQIVPCTVAVDAVPGGLFSRATIALTVTELWDEPQTIKMTATEQETDAALLAPDAGGNANIQHESSIFGFNGRQELLQLGLGEQGQLGSVGIQISTWKTGAFDVHTSRGDCVFLQKI